MVAALLCLCIYAYLVPLTTLLVLIFCQLNFYPLRLVKVLYCCKGHTLSNRIKQKQKQTKKKNPAGTVLTQNWKSVVTSDILSNNYLSFICSSILFFPFLRLFSLPCCSYIWSGVSHLAPGQRHNLCLSSFTALKLSRADNLFKFLCTYLYLQSPQRVDI